MALLRPSLGTRYRQYINGRWHSPTNSHREIERRDPADGAVVGSFQVGDESDVDAAVRAARVAFEHGPWSQWSPDRRAEVLARTARLIRESLPGLALLETWQSGIPLAQSEGILAGNADVFDYYAGLARELAGRTYQFGRETPVPLGITLREPLGVAAAISPWNFPFGQMVWKVAPALAVGCTVVAKPASWTPFTVLELARLLEAAGLPAGVFNVVTGPGPVVGRALADHSDVDMISFTGETATGSEIMARAARHLKRLSLELGGKSANVVFSDADLDAAVETVLQAIAFRCGQVCTAGARLVVEADVYEDVLERLVEGVRRIKVGDPLEPDTFMGPMIAEEQLLRVDGHVERGRADGARLLCGGKRLEGGRFDQGSFYPLTIFDGVDLRMPLWTEEIFGPVLAVVPFRAVDEAVEVVNDSPYGLSAGVWTQDLGRAYDVIARLRVGTVWVNSYNIINPQMPFGGYKHSGFGRELGREALEAFSEVKAVYVGSPPRSVRS